MLKTTSYHLYNVLSQKLHNYAITLMALSNVQSHHNPSNYHTTRLPCFEALRYTFFSFIMTDYFIRQGIETTVTDKIGY